MSSAEEKNTPKKKVDSIEITLPESLTSYLIPIAILLAAVIIAGAILMSSNRPVTTSTGTDTTTTTTPGEPNYEKIYTYVKSIGVDESKVRSCVDSNKFADRIKADITEGNKAGISGTPGFVIGYVDQSGNVKGTGIGGAFPYEAFEMVLNAYVNDDAEFIGFTTELKKYYGKYDTKSLKALSDYLDSVIAKRNYGSTSNVFTNMKSDLTEYQKTPNASTQAYLESDLKLISTETTVGTGAKIGNTSSKVAMVEYSDFECPFCQRHFLSAGKSIETNFVKNNKIMWVFRNYPLSFHDPVATEEAMVAECARDVSGNDETFFKVHDYIYTNTKTNKAGVQ